MKKILFALMLFVASVAAASGEEVEKQPAFPGAEGFGRYTTGGRGGAVYHVTSLADDGSEGTFRWACNQKGARTIVFDVSGTIYLTSELALKQGNVTIAGQTAPGDGVCVADYPFTIKASNVIIRYMRFRLGNRQVAHHEGDGLGGMDQQNIIVDHCSISWSVDECLSVYGCRNLTVQWCLVAQSMVNSGHSKGAHGYGGNWGGSGASYHHNLIAHHTSRTPRLGPRPSTQCDERMDMRNNVIYNWGGNGCYGGEGMNVNIVNNYYKPGPATERRNSTIQRRIAAIGIRTSEYTKHDTSTPNDWDKMWHVWGKFFVEGNVNTKYEDVTKDNWTYGMWNQVDASGNDGTYTQATRDTMRIDQPIDFVHVTTHTAETAYRKVVDLAGCSLHPDAYDTAVCNDVINGEAKAGTGSGNDPGFINSQNDVKYASASDCDEYHFPTLVSNTPLADSDGDGMPDQWETENGLNPNDANDGRRVSDNGYTNLENYLNSLIADITARQLADGKVEGYDEKNDVTPQETRKFIVFCDDFSHNSETNADGVTVAITGNTSKNLSGGNSIAVEGQDYRGIKVSNGAQNTITMPEGFKAMSVKFYSYVNKGSGDLPGARESYWKEVNGESYTGPIMKCPSDKPVNNPDINEYELGGVNAFTFTNAGEQVVYVAVITAAEGTGIHLIHADGEQLPFYNIFGQPVDEDYHGLIILNGRKMIRK